MNTEQVAFYHHALSLVDPPPGDKDHCEVSEGVPILCQIFSGASHEQFILRWYPSPKQLELCYYCHASYSAYEPSQILWFNDDIFGGSSLDASIPDQIELWRKSFEAANQSGIITSFRGRMLLTALLAYEPPPVTP